jgi:hypothetical protein
MRLGREYISDTVLDLRSDRCRAWCRYFLRDPAEPGSVLEYCCSSRFGAGGSGSDSESNSVPHSDSRLGFGSGSVSECGPDLGRAFDRSPVSWSGSWRDR